MDIAALPTHPASELFNLLEGEELTALSADIAERGLLEPVWIYDDPELGWCLLDGRNRRAACRKAGVEPRWQVYEGDDPLSFAISLNVRRRHLTAGQRAAIAYKALPLYEAQARQRQKVLAGTRPNLGADRHQGRAPRSADQAAQTAGTSGRSLARFKRIVEHSPDLVPKIEAATLELDRAERIIRDRQAEEAHRERARREAEAQAARPKVDIRLGDFREVLAGARPAFEALLSTLRGHHDQIWHGLTPADDPVWPSLGG